MYRCLPIPCLPKTGKEPLFANFLTEKNFSGKKRLFANFFLEKEKNYFGREIRLFVAVVW